MSKLYFYQCAHFLLFLSLPTFFIHHFHSYTKILTLITLIPTPNLLHSHPDSPHSHHIPTPIPRIPILIPRIHIIATLIPRIPTLILRIPIIPTLIPRIPTLILRIPIIPTLIPRIPIISLIPFSDSPFRLLQIAGNDAFLQADILVVY